MFESYEKQYEFTVLVHIGNLSWSYCNQKRLSLGLITSQNSINELYVVFFIKKRPLKLKGSLNPLVDEGVLYWFWSVIMDPKETCCRMRTGVEDY